MKKLVKILGSLIITSAFVLTGCTHNPNSGTHTVPVEKTETQPDSSYIAPADKTEADDANWALINYDLSAYNGKTVKIDFSCEMKVKNNTSEAKNLMWQLSIDGKYPVIASNSFAAGESDWITVASSEESKNESHTLGNGVQLYLSGYGLKATDVEIQVKNVKYTISYNEVVGEANWLDDSVPSLKETYSEYFDSIGIACEYSSWNGVKELSVKTVRDGIAKHADSVSMGNEFKPDGFFGYQWTGTGKAMVDFTASNGLTIKVPKVLQYDTQDKCLAACKEAGLKMRGHVLAWHAQTPESFFTVDYAAAQYEDAATQNILKNKVSKEVMQARLEWYIKTVLQHVADWEAANGYRAIWAWDVFNETVADDANATNWVRGSTPETKDRPPAAPAVNPGPCGSRWYQCYEDTDFIVDAFRFANAYAPADVKLCYNDYNEYMDYGNSLKTTGIMKLIQLVKNGEAKIINGKSVKPRIDVMGMQSHVGVSWPGVSGYESALKRFLTEVDVHVTELDIACTTVAESKKCWTDYCKMLKKYGKKYSGAHKVTNITIWGINNKSSWIYKGDVKYPVLFDNYMTTPAFWAVIEAAK